MEFQSLMRNLLIMILVMAVCTLSYRVYQIGELLRTEYENSEPVTVRNEWGQLRHNPEFMCEASIRQWLKECGK